MTKQEAIEILHKQALCDMDTCQVTTECSTCPYMVKANDAAEAYSIALDTLIRVSEREKADGCEGCKYVDTEEWKMPCADCSRGRKDRWRAAE